MKKFYLCKLCLIVFGALLTVHTGNSGNCRITGNEVIGDCGNVHFGQAEDVEVISRENLNGSYKTITVQPSAFLNFSGSADQIVAQDGSLINASGSTDMIEGTNAEVHLSGNTDTLLMEGGSAYVSGNVDLVVLNNAKVTLSGIAGSVTGKGVLIVKKGAIFNKEYFHSRRVINID